LSSIERTAANSHIEFVTDLQEISFPTEWYEANSEAHFWFQWRARATDALIRRLDLPVGSPLQVFDIGCGTGITCRLLGHTTSWVFDGADLNIEALTRCHAGVRRVLYYDILEKRQEFHERYDVIILFDVIEHIEHTTPFLDAVLFHLKPGGVILVNVPALMTLYGRYDTAAGHYRRYTKRTLADEFKPFDVSVVDQVYWGFTMVPLLFLRKLMQRAELSEDKTIRSGFYPPSPSAHTLLKTVMKLETGLVGRPPLGSSVLTAVRKNHADMTAKTPAPNIVETVAASGVPAPMFRPDTTIHQSRLPPTSKRWSVAPARWTTFPVSTCKRPNSCHCSIPWPPSTRRCLSPTKGLQIFGIGSTTRPIRTRMESFSIRCCAT